MGIVEESDCAKCRYADRDNAQIDALVASLTKVKRLPLWRRLWSWLFPPEGYPSLPAQAATLAGAVAKHVAGGMRSANEEAYRERLAICEGCDKYDRPLQRCKACGCGAGVGSLLDKLRMASESCPLGKWGATCSAG